MRPSWTAYVKDYLAKKAKPSWAKEAERLLRVEVVPEFGNKRLGDLTDDDIHKLLKEIAEGAPITANRTFAVSKTLSLDDVSRWRQAHKDVAMRRRRDAYGGAPAGANSR